MGVLYNTGKLQPSEVVQTIADRIFETLAKRFPVCSASDEFHYFPQVQAQKHSWSAWDDFSQEAIEDIAGELSIWEEDLSRLAKKHPDKDTLIDISMLIRVARTLRKELTEVRFQQTQPTFYLTIASIGLTEALDHNAVAWEDRVKGLPSFLDQARNNLNHIPSLFRDLGIEMVIDTRSWLSSIQNNRPGLGPVFKALDRFEDHLRQASTCDNFLISSEILERIIYGHIGCCMGIEDVQEELDQEIREMVKIMNEEARRLDHNSSWGEAIESIPLPPLPEDGLIALYRHAVLGLGKHCLEQGLVTHDIYSSCPVSVEPIPSYLSAVRSAAAYSMSPGHPPHGGTFFIVDLNLEKVQQKTLHRDCHMVAAHETYPGHHLLDASRWNLNRAIRRPLEFPLFYEGWACFAEELMIHTGYFRGPAERLLLARRNFLRAIRGKVDIGIQTGKMDLQAAASYLVRAGISKDRALSIVRRYALKPGYQSCYTIGLRRFRELYKRFGGDNPRDFALKVLPQGEIGFDNLEDVLMSEPDTAHHV